MAQALLQVPTENNLQYTLDSQYSSGGTSLVLNTNVSSKVQAPGVCVVDRIDSSGNKTASKRTYYKFTGVSTATLTGLSTVDGTDQDHAVGAIVEFVPDVDTFQSHYDALSAVVDPATGTVDLTKVVTPTATQTLTNKTLTTPTISDLTNAGHTHQNTAGGGTLAESALALTDVTTNDVSATKHGFAPKFPNNTTTFLRGDGTYAAPGGSSDGWTDHSAVTWTYASASTFTIAGVDLTTTFTKGTRLKFTQTTVKYAVVVSSSFSTNTTVTIAVNDTYTIANAAITANYYSYQVNPQGYPNWFTFSTTLGGFSVAPTWKLYYNIIGQQCFFYLQDTGTGTSNATTFTFTVPVAVAKSLSSLGAVHVTDNGANQSVLGHISSTASSTTLSVYKSFYQGVWTGSGAKNVYIGSPISYEF